MRAIILDDTLEVSERAGHVLPPLGVDVSCARSLGELLVLFGSGRSPELLIVNATATVSPEPLARKLRQLKFRGRLLVFTPHDLGRRVGPLAELPGAECVARPESAEGIDALMARAIAGHAPSLPGLGSAGMGPAPRGLVGQSATMLRIFSRIEKVARADVNVCIYGESGTGKELIARAIHEASPRRDRPFVTLDCASIPEGLMESQLFGHVRGAFTGAVEHRDGVFALANTGTLFLDELCELGVPLQAKLLRVIQSREFVPVGGTRPVRSNIRLITATNKDPKAQVERGEFREDLYYRVAVMMMNLPPLRERREDIPLLAEHFVQTLAQRHRKPLRGIDAAALEHLASEPWPGNVRQLENFIEQAVVLAEGETLTSGDLFGAEFRRAAAPETPASRFAPGLPLREVERQHILATLEATGGNRTETARQLGISLRSLQYKLKEYRETASLR
jgi:two-component system response regulator HydG